MDADGRAVLRACGAGGLTDPAGRLPDPLAADSRRTPPGPDRGTPRDPGMKPAPMSLKKIWLLLALLAVVVHGAWIQTVRVCMPEYGASPYKYPYNMGDSGSYTLSSQALFDSRAHPGFHQSAEARLLAADGARKHSIKARPQRPRPAERAPHIGGEGRDRNAQDGGPGQGVGRSCGAKNPGRFTARSHHIGAHPQ